MIDRVENMPRWRIAVLAIFVIGALWLLLGKLHTIQVLESSAYESSQVRQSVRRVLIPAPRGRIFDRHGEPLADNRPSYCIAVYVEELRKPGAWSNTVNAVDARIDELSAALGIKRQVTRDEIRQHISKRLPLPLLAWRDIDDRTLARFSEEFANEPGMDVYVQPERIYPHGSLASHLLGYVGRDKPVATNEVFHYNLLGMKGRSGIEASMNDRLSGIPGGKLITVDVSGYRHAETNRPAIPGQDVTLTIDSSLQGELERLLAGYRGSAVAVDPRNGEILALVSSPAFDPNELSPSIPPAVWKKLTAQATGRPLLNRAITGTYPPGSIFKPCVALAALHAGVSPSITFSCNGVFTLGSMHLRCSARAGHGENIGIRYALEQSCNPFFCSLGTHIKLDAIRDYAATLGFGRRTGICLGGEAAGLLPDDAWKKRVRRDGWRAGDTANLAIGQGYLLVTPLQIGMYAATLANGGTLYMPKVVLDDSIPGQGTKIDVKPQHMAIVRGGMYDVVNKVRDSGPLALRGTGWRARVPGIAVAAKTGTAEYGPRANRRKHTWMISFAPYENPTIALAVLVEDGESGGRTVAPIISVALCHYFGVEPESEELDDENGNQEEEGGSPVTGGNAEFGMTNDEVRSFKVSRFQSFTGKPLTFNFELRTSNFEQRTKRGVPC